MFYVAHVFFSWGGHIILMSLYGRERTHAQEAHENPPQMSSIRSETERARAHNIAAGGFSGQFYEPRQTWPNVCGNIEPAAPSGRDRLRFLWEIHFNTSFASASQKNIY